MLRGFAERRATGRHPADGGGAGGNLRACGSILHQKIKRLNNEVMKNLNIFAFVALHLFLSVILCFLHSIAESMDVVDRDATFLLGMIALFLYVGFRFMIEDKK
jgi:hypothetical protein